MAYDRYVPEFTDKDGQIYGVMDAEAREEVSELNSALNALGLSVVDGKINITYEEDVA